MKLSLYFVALKIGRALMNNAVDSHAYCANTDEQLALLAKNGDEDALTLLIQRYIPQVMLRAKAFARGGLDVDDLLQEGMLALLKAVRHYRRDGGGSFRTFAMVCVNNKLTSAVTALQSNKTLPMQSYVSLSEPDGAHEQIRMLSTQSSPELLLIESEEAQARSQRMQTLLSSFELSVLRLYLSSYSYAEMAQRLHSTVKAVDNALQRVRRKLRGAFTCD